MSTHCDICNKLIPYDEGVETLLRQSYNDQSHNLNLFICKECARKLAYVATGGQQFRYDAVSVYARLSRKLSRKLKCNNCGCYRSSFPFGDVTKYVVGVRGQEDTIMLCNSCASLYFAQEELDCVDTYRSEDEVK